MSKERLQLMHREALEEITGFRAGETKLGHTMGSLGSLDELSSHPARFVLLGICEDIGIRANHGKGGAARTWDWAIKAIANVQSNAYLHGEEIVVLGALEFEEAMNKAEDLNPSVPADLEELRRLTAEIDQAVSEVIQTIVEKGKIPIVIGGGHNNAYGNITGSSKALNSPINVINIDPHADYRELEGRHSGNPFSYARKDNQLGKYGVFGLYEGYNNSHILDAFRADPDLTFITFESLLSVSWEQRYHRFTDLLNWAGEGAMGLEVDLDCLNNFPVSALNPSGFDLNQLREMVRVGASLKDLHYLHLCEGSVGQCESDQQRELLAKAIALLVTDFVKAHHR